MGSDDHYPEEAPAHEVSVGGFWIDATPVTNLQFGRFVKATGHVTLAERAPAGADYPGAKPELLVPGSVVFRQPRQRVDLRNHLNWWDWVPGADWRHPEGPGSTLQGRERHPVVHVAFEDARPTPPGRARRCRPRPSGSSPPGAGSEAGRSTPGATSWRPAASRWPTPGRGSSPGRHLRPGRVRAHLPGRAVPAQRLRPLRPDRQRLGVDDGLVPAPRRDRPVPPAAPGRAPGQPRRGPRGSAATTPARPRSPSPAG